MNALNSKFSSTPKNDWLYTFFEKQMFRYNKEICWQYANIHPASAISLWTNIIKWQYTYVTYASI